MTIAFVYDAIYPYNKGGKEKRLFEFSTRLAKMGHEVHIYTMHWWEGPKDRVEHGVHLHAIGKLHNMYINEQRSVKEGVFFGLACLRLITQPFDVVDVDHMPFFPLYSVWLVCRLRGKKMFATYNEVWGREYWIKYMGSLGNVAALIERLSVLLPDTIISISPLTSKALVTKLHCKKPLVEIACGVDFKQIQKATAAKEKSDVIFAGRLFKHKRLDLLIKAVAKLSDSGKNVRCLIIGEGSERLGLEQLASKLNVNKLIAFHDFYEDSADVYANIKASKVYASPSEREGFGISAIEANACGKPIVTNLASGNATKDLVVEGRNGFIFKGNASNLATTLKIAIRSSKKTEEQCIEYAKKFDWGSLSKQLSRVYTQ